MGMDPADDFVYETPTHLRSMGANNEEATEELEIEIVTSEDVDSLQLRAPYCQAPKWSRNIDIFTLPTGTCANSASWAETPASPMGAADPRRSH